MIKPGNFKSPPVEDYADYANSMAEQIEEELNALLALDGLPTLSLDPDDREVRDRRRLFVAVTRGIVRHLVEQADAIDVVRVDSSVVHPTFQTEGL